MIGREAGFTTPFLFSSRKRGRAMPYQEIEAMLASARTDSFRCAHGWTDVAAGVAAVCDYRTHRIPNRLIFCGAAIRRDLHDCGALRHSRHLLFPLSGLLVGFLVFLPLYLLRAMGAGDVKLLAMVGAFLGSVETSEVALASMIVGGVLSIRVGASAWPDVSHASKPRFIFSVRNAWCHSRFNIGYAHHAGGLGGILPYGVVIATGTMGYLSVHDLGLV